MDVVGLMGVVWILREPFLPFAFLLFYLFKLECRWLKMQPCGLVKAEHKVHVLYCLPYCPFQ